MLIYTYLILKKKLYTADVVTKQSFAVSALSSNRKNGTLITHMEKPLSRRREEFLLTGFIPLMSSFIELDNVLTSKSCGIAST